MAEFFNQHATLFGVGIISFVVVGLVLMTALFVSAIIEGRRTARKRQAFAARHGWQFVKFRNDPEELHWSGRWPCGTSWQLTVIPRDDEHKDNSRSFLCINYDGGHRGGELMPQPGIVAGVILPADQLPKWRDSYGEPMRGAPGDGVLGRSFKAYLRANLRVMMGQSFREFITDAATVTIPLLNNFVLVSRSAPPSTGPLQDAVAHLDLITKASYRDPPLILFGLHEVIVLLTQEVKDEKEIEDVVDAGYRLWLAAPLASVR